jgi:hypothetical protein
MTQPGAARKVWVRFHHEDDDEDDAKYDRDACIALSRKLCGEIQRSSLVPALKNFFAAEAVDAMSSTISMPDRIELSSPAVMHRPTPIDIIMSAIHSKYSQIINQTDLVSLSLINLQKSTKLAHTQEINTSSAQQ